MPLHFDPAPVTGSGPFPLLVGAFCHRQYTGYDGGVVLRHGAETVGPRPPRLPPASATLAVDVVVFSAAGSGPGVAPAPPPASSSRDPPRQLPRLAKVVVVAVVVERSGAARALALRGALRRGAGRAAALGAQLQRRQLGRQAGAGRGAARIGPGGRVAAVGGAAQGRRVRAHLPLVRRQELGQRGGVGGTEARAALQALLGLLLPLAHVVHPVDVDV